MFPWVYGFEWTAGRIVFLGIFFSVLLVMFLTVAFVFLKSAVHFRTGRAYFIQWKSLFHELPRASRACRHALTGHLPGRVCEGAFECRECSKHGELLEQGREAAIGAGAEEIMGMTVPLDRYYHRGHCWVKPLKKGLVAVGLDELGRRLVGRPDAVETPPPGTWLVANSTAFWVKRNGTAVRVLAPVDGEVIAAGGPSDDWILKVRPPAPLDTRHLLRGDEVRAWYRREVERLELIAGRADGAPALADGGELCADLGEAFPERWDAVCGEMLLDT
ncbi:MAG: hypothetical protein KIT09_19430 [Bryobacteraceae bacterium]|nr:hypothetical protein [Bryobacteraceae bacterium]